MRSKLLIGVIGGACVVLIWVVSHLYKELLTAYEQSGTLTDMEYSWVFRLLLNMAGYATVLLPLFIIYKYLEKTNYFDKISNTSNVSRILFACFGEQNERLPEALKPSAVEETPARESAELVLCFGGLMTTYLIWGLLQEKIMTQNYIMPDGKLVKFHDSQFLVFINRFLALVIAVARLWCTGQSMLTVPLYKYSYCSLTNVVSAWCQYEALKYVSFPTQVLSKSCKVIPVMLMGKVVSNNKYELYEYVTAVFISVGMVLFMFGSHDDYSASTAMTLSGVTLLALYMLCDSFTASWQGALFARHQCAPLAMLAGVNLFSCALTAAALHHRPTTSESIALLAHPMFATDCMLLSVSSALGQLLIYRTIAKFGAVVFTIIMTLRQALSILLSCVVYGHHVSAGGVLGVTLVFVALFMRVYCRQRLRSRRAAHV